MTRQELINLCLTLPGAYEDYPFNDDGWCVIRHSQNKKGLAHIYERNDRLCVNLKCSPAESDFLRQIFADITPAYHMNKTHWNTVALNGDVPEEELLRLITRSFDLIKPQVKRSRHAHSG